MSHQIPDFFRYVSEIEIVNRGSEYTSIPTITISGGGGTGATATASIFNKQIQAVNITNVGRDYTSAPTVTATGGGGGGATFNAKLEFANATPTEYTEKSSTGIKYTLPEFVQNDYDKFVTFIEKYYEFMDSDGNPANLLLNKDYNDIDELETAELNKRAEELARYFPQILQADRKTLLKKIKNIYESKGSERSIKAYFKLLYNEEVEIYYPSKNILRTSDGVWIDEISARVVSGYNGYEVLNLNGRPVDIKYWRYDGAQNRLETIQAVIQSTRKIAYTSPQIYELVLDLPSGITEIPGPGAGAEATVTVSGGIITEYEITNGGLQYTARPTVALSGAGAGTGFKASAVVVDGIIDSITIDNAGSGYTDGTYSLSFDTSEVETFIIDRSATSEEENIRAYFERSISSVATGAYSGEDAGFKVGDIFFVNETQNNDCVIRVLTVDSSNVPVKWSIITPGRNFENAQNTVAITSRSGETLNITFTTSYTFKYDGKYKDSRGHLSDANRLQDNFKYQSYSYIIKSSIAQDRWAKRFRDLMHPAGMEVFGDLIISNNLNYAPFISITTDGLHLHEFKTEDIVSNDDSVEIVVQWFRDFNETQTVTDSQFFDTQKGLVDTVGIIDSYDEFEYAGPDYLPENYVGSGVSKFVEKGLNDTAVSSEIFSPAMQFVRAFADDVANSTDSILLALNIGATAADSTSEIADTQTVETGKNISDIAGATDDYVQDYIEDGVLPEAYIGGGIFKLVEKVLTDSIVVSESFAPAVVYEREFFENITKTDLLSITTLPEYTEEVVVSDVFSYEKFRDVSFDEPLNSSDTITLTLQNSFSNTIASSEISVININKALVESQTATDAATLITEKPFTETSNVSDGGVVSIQDYAPTYFAEDYVGESYSF